MVHARGLARSIALLSLENHDASVWGCKFNGMTEVKELTPDAVRRAVRDYYEVTDAQTFVNDVKLVAPELVPDPPVPGKSERAQAAKPGEATS